MARRTLMLQTAHTRTEALKTIYTRLNAKAPMKHMHTKGAERTQIKIELTRASRNARDKLMLLNIRSVHERFSELVFEMLMQILGKPGSAIKK